MVLIIPRFTAVLVTMLLLVTASVQAATVTFSTTLPLAAVANPASGAVTGANAVFNQNVTGSIFNQRRSPWDAANSTVPVGTGLYSSIRSSKAGFATVDFNFSSVMKQLSFVWGTPGPQNRIEFFLGGVSQFALFGNTIIGGNTAQGLSVGGTLSLLTKITGLTFDKVVFRAGKPALEFANLTTVAAVPLPAAGLLFLGALGGLMALRRRKMVI